MKARPASFYNKRVMLQKDIQTQSAHGGLVTTYQDVEYIWANIKPMSAAGRYFSQQVVPMVNTEIRMRYREDVLVGWRVKSEEHTFTMLEAPIDVDYSGVELLVNCRQIQVEKP